MTTQAPEASTSRLDHLRLDQIDPDPQNRKVTTDTEFVASIREHGVLEPILVVPHPDNEERYLIVAGERRWRGAGKAKLDSIPAVIRLDMDEKARVEAQVSENLHRSDLAPCEEGIQLTRLITLGHDVKSLAAAVGRSQGHVRKRLKLVELPRGARKLIDNGDWSIDEGLAALKLLNHPEQLAEIVERQPHNVGHAVKRVLDQLEFDTRNEKLLARVERDGLVVLDDLPRSGAQLAALGIAENDHTGEECHAHLISGNREWGSGPKLVGICTKPNRHRVEGPSELKAPHRPGKTTAERAEAAAKRQAKEERHAAMAATLKGRIGKGDCYTLILSAFLDGVGHETATAVCELLEIKARKTDGIHYPAGDLQRFAAKSEPNRLRAAVAIAMFNHEQQFQHWGSAEASVVWLDWLGARGYQPSEWDQQHVAGKKRR